MDFQEMRNIINNIDDQFVSLFVERMKASARIGEYKMEHGMNIHDPKREQEIIDTLSEKAGKLYAPYVQALYRDVFDLSRQLQTQLRQISSIEYGLIGRDVSYSYNKWIHHAMGNQSYGLYSLSEELLPLLFSRRTFKGLNVTAPYKKAVLEYCSRLDDSAAETGYANTIVKEDDGTLTAYNTEYDGLIYAAKKAGISLAGKKIMLIGDGAFAASVKKAAADSGVKELVVVSRTGKTNFRNYTEHKDTEILINATPIGMTPNSDLLPADLDALPNLCGVLDAVYTPVQTKLIEAAREKGIPNGDGLTILIEKNAKSSSLFGFEPDENTCSELYEELTSFIE